MEEVVGSDLVSDEVSHHLAVIQCLCPASCCLREHACMHLPAAACVLPTPVPGFMEARLGHACRTPSGTAVRWCALCER